MGSFFEALDGRRPDEALLRLEELSLELRRRRCGRNPCMVGGTIIERGRVEIPAGFTEQFLNWFRARTEAAWCMYQPRTFEDYVAAAVGIGVRGLVE